MRYLYFLLLLGLFACKTEAPPAAPVNLSGTTMGTTYSIIYLDPAQRNYRSSIDSLLVAINAEVSTYEPESFISRWNRSPTGVLLRRPLAEEAPHFATNLENARRTYEVTKGYFDPTIMPLVNHWGFGYTQERLATATDTAVIDSLRRSVGFADKVVSQGPQQLAKTDPGVQLDFSGNAKGYGVDEVGRLLEKRGIKNYLVEIGGEVRARGRNAQDSIWTVGINVPDETADITDFQAIAKLDNRSIATSGNYRNHYDVEGERVSHIINPKTGFPEQRSILSASVFAEDCMTADAYATAFMVMGWEEAFELARNTPELEAYLVFTNEENELKYLYTVGLEDVFREL